MSGVIFKSVKKSFGDTHVIKDFSFEINDGEFIAFLGPSGCGKTTCLRMVAGLEKNTGGSIYIGDKEVSNFETNVFLAPEKRKIGMVFQSYAVWPHMNVFDNVAYPLKVSKVAKSEINQRVKDILEIVELDGLEKRMPNQLSGGQQQRVALARGLIAQPEVLLLDEPLSNLDAKLREKMRKDIRKIQKDFGITVIYVTHDQIEAVEMSDRMVILKDGEIVQAGTPSEVKNNPVNQFVENFLS